MYRHLLNYILKLIFLLCLKFSKDIDFLHNVHDNFSFPEISLSDNSVKSFSVKLKTSSFGFYSYICCSFSVIEHWNFSKHLSLTDCLYVNLLSFRSSIAVQFTFINDINLVSLISLFYNDSVLLICFYCHCWNQFWSVSIVKIFE